MASLTGSSQYTYMEDYKNIIRVDVSSICKINPSKNMTVYIPALIFLQMELLKSVCSRILNCFTIFDLIPWSKICLVDVLSTPILSLSWVNSSYSIETTVTHGLKFLLIFWFPSLLFFMSCNSILMYQGKNISTLDSTATLHSLGIALDL